VVFLAFGAFVFQPFHPSPLDHLPLFFTATTPMQVNACIQPWKHVLFLFARSAAVANRRHASNLVPGAMKRNRATKSLPAAQPLFQVNMHAYTIR
jgi:hypothetical protein